MTCRSMLSILKGKEVVVEILTPTPCALHTRQIDQAQNTKIIETSFNHVPFKGKVVMDRSKKGVRAGGGERAENQFWYFEDSMASEGEEGVTKGFNHGAVKCVWFAREVSIGGREMLVDYDLKKRDYLCSTSMTAENSFLVANFAHASKGKLILDPFCGSASLLVSCAHFGAMTMGGDIDIRVIRGKEKDKEMVTSRKAPYHPSTSIFPRPAPQA